MIKRILLLTLLAWSVGFALSGCGGREVEHKTTIIRETAPRSLPDSMTVQAPPPALRDEPMGEAPSPAYVWIPGYWRWEDSWVWKAGHWELPPSTTTAWIAGEWVQTSNGWVWRPGHWR